MEGFGKLSGNMVFFKKKAAEAKPVKVRSLHEIVTERVLTAEGWQRQTSAHAEKKVKKK